MLQIAYRQQYGRKASLFQVQTKLKKEQCLFLQTT